MEHSLSTKWVVCYYCSAGINKSIWVFYWLKIALFPSVIRILSDFLSSSYLNGTAVSLLPSVLCTETKRKLVSACFTQLDPSLQFLWFVCQWKAKKGEKSKSTGKTRRKKLRFSQAALGLTATQLGLICGHRVSEHKSIREKAQKALLRDWQLVKGHY